MIGCLIILVVGWFGLFLRLFCRMKLKGSSYLFRDRTETCIFSPRTPRRSRRQDLVAESTGMRRQPNPIERQIGRVSGSNIWFGISILRGAEVLHLQCSKAWGDKCLCGSLSQFFKLSDGNLMPLRFIYIAIWWTARSHPYFRRMKCHLNPISYLRSLWL